MNGVPQGSVLGHFLFLIYVHGVPDLLQWDVFPFADDVNFISVSVKFDDLQRDRKTHMGLGFSLRPSVE